MYAVDDATPDISKDDWYDWVRPFTISAFKFETNGGLTRSWNHGLRFCRNNQIEYAVAGNSDLLFAPGWDTGIIKALEDYDLVGPITNASGWGTPRQNIRTYIDKYHPSDKAEHLSEVSTSVGGLQPVPLHPTYIEFKSIGAKYVVPEFLNGFCMVARTTTWWRGKHDEMNVFNPAYKLTENEVELQFRWAGWARRAVVPSSYVFHYRSISRGDQHMCEGAYRNAAPQV